MTKAQTEQPSQVRRELVEDAILAAAARLFSRQGAAATKLSDVAAEVGISRPGLYHYFAGKREIYIRLISDLIAESAAAPDLSEIDSWEERLKAFIEHLLRPILRSPDRFRLLSGALEIDIPPDIRQAWRDNARTLERQLTELVEGGMRDGEFRGGDVDVTVLAMVGVVNWTAWWRNRLSRQTDEELLAKLVAAALRIVQPSAANGSRSPRASAQDALAVLQEVVDNMGDSPARNLHDDDEGGPLGVWGFDFTVGDQIES
jgi:AcrR family transcriptional regulator